MNTLTSNLPLNHQKNIEIDPTWRSDRTKSCPIWMSNRTKSYPETRTNPFRKGCVVGCGFHVVVGHSVNGSLVLGPKLRTKKKVRGVVGCVSFGCVGRNCITKTTQRISFWHHFHPILHQLGAKGDLKINKNNNKLKTCKPKYKQNEKS